MRRPKRRPRTVRCRRCKSQNQSQPKGWVPIFCGRKMPAARGRAQSRFRPTLTPINMLGRLDTERVRNAIRAEILAILRDMGTPTPPHKPKRPHFRSRVTVAEMFRCQCRAAREVNIERKTRAPRPPRGSIDAPKKFNRRTDRRASLRKKQFAAHDGWSLIGLAAASDPTVGKSGLPTVGHRKAHFAEFCGRNESSAAQVFRTLAIGKALR